MRPSGKSSGDFGITSPSFDSMLHKDRVKEICNGTHCLNTNACIGIAFRNFEERLTIAGVRNDPNSVEPSRDIQLLELSLERRDSLAAAPFDLRLRFDPRQVT